MTKASVNAEKLTRLTSKPSLDTPYNAPQGLFPPNLSATVPNPSATKPLDPNRKFWEVEHCPNFDERFTLSDGKTYAKPYPYPGWNCNNSWAL